MLMPVSHILVYLGWRRGHMTERPEPSGNGQRSGTIVPVVVALIGLVATVTVAIIETRSGNSDPPRPISTTVDSTATTISEEQDESRKRRLLSVISDQGIRATCSKTADNHLTGSLMAMDCPSPEVAALRIGLYPSETAMYIVYNRGVEEAGLERKSGSGDFCKAEPAEGTWSFSGKDPPDGRIFCYVNDEGQVWFEWTYDKAKVIAYAYRRDDNFGALDRWWKNFF
jgi:hypothetical protein